MSYITVDIPAGCNTTRERAGRLLTCARRPWLALDRSRLPPNGPAGSAKPPPLSERQGHGVQPGAQQLHRRSMYGAQISPSDVTASIPVPNL